MSLFTMLLAQKASKFRVCWMFLKLRVHYGVCFPQILQIHGNCWKCWYNQQFPSSACGESREMLCFPTFPTISMTPETRARAPELFRSSWKLLEMLVKATVSMICLWGIIFRLQNPTTTLTLLSINKWTFNEHVCVCVKKR